MHVNNTHTHTHTQPQYTHAHNDTHTMTQHTHAHTTHTQLTHPCYIYHTALTDSDPESYQGVRTVKPQTKRTGDTTAKGYHDSGTGLRSKRSDTAGKVAPTCWWFCFSAPLPEAWPPLSPVPPLAPAPPAPYNEKTPSLSDVCPCKRFKNFFIGVNRVIKNQIYGIL